ncbi:hypothetical protein GPECTOR_87g434 [Gonium pectorale]|uniref:Uncharacterized protein n=1 Tax=Gonium pectorale TaxID=33097 RepID=A0A150G172_GONPE|nr:hypothetical protein GPECTOR_87g434 [Gonium pectorale]|eukprot:KXZ43571.1 hypothetical protein GPECTOR_87g434 [Gonium pectorale]
MSALRRAPAAMAPLLRRWWTHTAYTAAAPALACWPAAGAKPFSAAAAAGSETPVYLVFGAGGGIGSALVERLTRGSAGGAGPGGGGARVVLAGLHGDKLHAAAERAGAAGGPGSGSGSGSGSGGQQGGSGSGSGGGDVLECDAMQPEQVESVVSTVVSRYGRLDGVASCVGDVRAGAAATTSLPDFKRALLKQPGGGSLVLVSAAVAETGIPHWEAMSAAKAGVEGLARATAASYAPRGLRVNCVAPGLTRTEQTTAFTQGSASVREASVAMVPSRRFATPGDVAAAMAFLLSTESAFMNGQVLAVDGGMSTLQPQPQPQLQPQMPSGGDT